jgi:hypothetical protein
VNTADVDQVQALARDWFVAKSGAAPSIEELGAFPDVYGDGFIVESDDPNCLALAKTGASWTTLHFNSFAELADLAERCSKELACRVVLVRAQSVTDVFLIRIWENGSAVRALEWVGESGEWLRDEGTPLPFEKALLGEQDEEFEREGLDRDMVQSYCEKLGLALWDDSAEPERWRVLRETRRPWWKFWN